uniref:Retrotransposon Gag domain, retroviral aspartyl protease n=1 Tax=Tanacetum cinerariifolium TaxID=118510 RepID=A0A6L2NC38_TANCI|nr:retrotransposon Gag domain, retroviral aspartyl protease [Tanacetum cinerariifolium]
MVHTRNSDNNNPPDPIATQLAAIAAKLEAFETMKEDIEALNEGERSRSSRNGKAFFYFSDFKACSKHEGISSEQSFTANAFALLDRFLSAMLAIGYLAPLVVFLESIVLVELLCLILAEEHTFLTLPLHVPAKFQKWNQVQRGVLVVRSKEAQLTRKLLEHSHADKDQLKVYARKRNIYHLVPLPGNQNKVHTQNSNNINPPDPIATQLAAIAAKLEAFETMKEDIAAFKEGE